MDFKASFEFEGWGNGWGNGCFQNVMGLNDGFIRDASKLRRGLVDGADTFSPAES